MEVDSLYNRLMEEKELALSTAEVQAYEEMFQQTKKYEQLEGRYK